MKAFWKTGFTAIAVASALTLAACGGGGDGGGSTTPATSPQPTPSTPAPSTPQTSDAATTATSVPTPTYASTDERLNLFNLINNFRSQIGVGMLRQDPMLDVAAQAHVTYMVANGVTDGHSEDSTKPSFYAAYPRDRATKAGVPASTWVGETISGTGTAADCFGIMTNSVYHLMAITANQETVGLGFNSLCVMNFGTITGQVGTPTLNAIPIGGGQQMASNAVAYTPIAGTTVDRFADSGESPRPAPDIARPGHPLMVRVRTDSTSDVLSVAAFKLVDNTGADVPGRILIAPNAQSASASGAVADSNLNPGVAFFLPLNPLGSNQTYTATFSGARNGKSIGVSWSFKTYF